MQAQTEQSVAATGSIDVAALCVILEPAVSDPKQRRAVISAVAEFIGTAFDGTVINVSDWTPTPPPR